VAVSGFVDFRIQLDQIVTSTSVHIYRSRNGIQFASSDRFPIVYATVMDRIPQVRITTRHWTGSGNHACSIAEL
jgi:hypothetical protein